jgi:hypothetical protein
LFRKIGTKNAFLTNDCSRAYSNLNLFEVGMPLMY